LSGCTNHGGTVSFFCAKFIKTGKLFSQNQKNILQKVFSEQENFLTVCSYLFTVITVKNSYKLMNGKAATIAAARLYNEVCYGDVIFQRQTYEPQ
jgi:hypothetical protein